MNHPHNIKAESRVTLQKDNSAATSVALFEAIQAEGKKRLHWVRSNKNGILVHIFSSAVLLSVLPLLSLFWKAVSAAKPAPHGLLYVLRTNIRVSGWVLPALFLLPLVLFHLFWYIRLYRYRADTFFGLDFTWLYSFPGGRVVRVRALCPHCQKPAAEPVGFLDQYDNYYLVSRIHGRIPVPEVFPTCDIRRFPSLYRCESHRTVWSPLGFCCLALRRGRWRSLPWL